MSLARLTLRLGLAASIGAWTLADAGLSGAAPPPAVSDSVRATVLPGTGQYPSTPVRPAPAAGDVTLNYPGVEAADLAKAILGDLLHLTYTVAPGARGSVSLVTERPVAREAVLGLFEQALSGANLALVQRGAGFAVVPIAEARTLAAPASAGQPGFATETLTLKFIGATQLKTLLDPVVPGAIAAADDAHATLVITGNSMQRRAVIDLVKQFDVDWLRGASFALFIPQHTDSRLIVPELQKLVDGPGAPTAGLVRLIGMDRLNGILAVANQPQLLEDVRRWIEVLDREGESTERRLFVYKVQNGRASDLAKTLIAAFGGGGAAGGPSGRDPLAFDSQAGGRSSFGGLDSVSPAPATPSAASSGRGAAPPALSLSAEGGATITSDEANNAVVLFVTPREYAVIADGLRKLDVLPLQVVIEAVVAEVQLTAGLRYGVQFSGAKGGSQATLSQDVSGLPTNIFPGFSYTYTAPGADSITATLNALSNLTRVDVLSSPKLMVLNNHTASLQVGDQVPIATGSSVSTIGSNAPIVNSIEYRDTGVILKITPRVNAGGLVLLDIYQEISLVASTNTSTINSPTIQQRRFTSSVALQDGQTVALGGLIRDSRTNSRAGIPVLSSIPILGALAGNRGKDSTKTELIVLLTPRVIASASDAQAVTDDLRRKIESIKPIEPMKAYRP